MDDFEEVVPAVIETQSPKPGVFWYIKCTPNLKTMTSHNRGPFSSRHLALLAINSNYKSFDIARGLKWSYEIVSKNYASDDDMALLDKDIRGFPYGIS